MLAFLKRHNLARELINKGVSMVKLLKFESMWKMCMIAFVAFTMFLSAPIANVKAQASNDMVTQTLCNTVNTLTGGIGKAISIIIVISLAFGLFLGKVSWGMAIGVAAAMGALFGSRDLVALIAGGNRIC